MPVTRSYVASSARLRLRLLDEDDVEPVGMWLADAALRRSYLVTDEEVPGEETISDVLAWSRADEHVAAFAVEHADGRLMGMGNWRPDLPFHWVYEIEVTLGPEIVTGHGYGTEAHQMVIDHLFSSVAHVEKVMGRIALFNEAMLAICPKIGAQQEGRLRAHARVDGKPIDLAVVGVLRSEWERRRHG